MLSGAQEAGGKVYRRILITGAAGAIGTALRHGLRGRFPLLRLSDVAPLGEAAEGEEVVPADLGDPLAIGRACEGCDAVVHLGGTPVEAPWEGIHANNIVGAYNLFEAARQQGVKRVVFASSNHVIGFHRRRRPLDGDAALRPDSRYGVSKVFGEALGRLYADKHGLEVVCLRIGSFRLQPTDVRMLSTWISPRDMVDLARAALEAQDVHFEVVYGLSANSRAIWDLTGAERLGYRPQDNAEAYATAILSAPGRTGEGPVPPASTEPENEQLFHGGSFCTMEFSGDPSRID
jgi:uronate dehydrogenase